MPRKWIKGSLWTVLSNYKIFRTAVNNMKTLISLFLYMYRAPFIILYYDRRTQNYLYTIIVHSLVIVQNNEGT